MRTLLLLALLSLLPATAWAEEPAGSLLDELSATLPDSMSLEGKVVYVDFWASWCAPCQKSFPWMDSLARRLGPQGLTVITVNLDRDRKPAGKFLEKVRVDLPVVFDPEGKLAERCSLQAMPTAFIFGRDGTLARRHEGFHDKDREELETLLVELLRGEGSR